MEPVFSPDAVAAFVADQRDEQEESVLAAIGITATVLNLLVIIFVYIYNTASRQAHEGRYWAAIWHSEEHNKVVRLSMISVNT
ncbi:unnamed protein product [Lampetra planeri]